jgi:hypothetical protein
MANFMIGVFYLSFNNNKKYYTKQKGPQCGLSQVYSYKYLSIRNGYCPLLE